MSSCGVLVLFLFFKIDLFERARAHKCGEGPGERKAGRLVLSAQPRRGAPSRGPEIVTQAEIKSHVPLLAFSNSSSDVRW